MKTTKSKQILKSKEVQIFLTKANDFCKLIEGSGKLKKQIFISKIHRVLLELYLATTSLPNIKVNNILNFDDKSLDYKDYKKISNKLKKKLGPKHIYYTEVFDPINPTKDEPTKASLDDDLADIYIDIKNGLNNIDKFSAEEVVVYLKELFYIHWGNHSIDALRAMHYLIYRHNNKI